MKHSANRIRTSHVGRLPPPKGWEDMPAKLAAGEIVNRDEIAAKIEPAIAEVVRRQVEIGIDCVGDGEFWTGRNFAHYATHLDGVAVRPLKPGETGSSREVTRERDEFSEFYAAMDKVGTMFFVPGEKPMQPIRERVVAQRADQVQGHGGDPARDRQLQGGDREIGRHGGRGLHPGAGAGLARPFHL